MTTETGPDAYAPFGLRTDSAALGLSEVTVSSALGTAIGHYRRDSPSSRATIFLHGAAGSWTTWTPLLQEAQRTGIPITNPILIDLPGWGDAVLSAAPEDVTINAVCALVKDCAEELGFTQWDVIGHSMGGFIALHLAATWPQSVLSVGVISGTGESILRSVEHPVRSFRALPAFTLLWRAMVVLAALGPVGAAIVRAAGAIGALPLLVRPLFRHTGRLDPSVIAALGRELRPASFSIAASLVRNYDLDDVWARIDCPVRALNGDHDVFSTPADLIRLGVSVPHSTITVVGDCGHFAAVERPAEVLVALGYAG
ncbi:MAG: alpha/beta hydrolase [Glaciihabitans sp.]|nr:alpha/beta hydrolase [Glaciihabitans sp.]